MTNEDVPYIVGSLNRMCARATRKHDKSKDSERNECMNTTGRPANCRVHDRVVGAMEANYQRLCGAGKKEKGKQRWRNDTSEREKVLFKTIDNGFPASPIVEYQFKWGNSHQLPLLPQTPSPFGDRNELSLPNKFGITQTSNISSALHHPFSNLFLHARGPSSAGRAEW